MTRLPGSFRDPAGYVYVSDNVVYRRIDAAGREAYERLMRSGLYEALVSDGLLIAHEDVGPRPEQPDAWTVIRPERVPLVSYPYEWCVSQLRDAALLLLRVQKRALDFGLSLKDASAYNVQFLRGGPVFIDTLSFEPHRPGPWLAYRQFCQHFYAPLLLASQADPRLSRLSQVFLDGVPLALASRLLPVSSWLRPGPLMHIHLHAKAEDRLGARHVTSHLPTPNSQLPTFKPQPPTPNAQTVSESGNAKLGIGSWGLGVNKGLTPLLESLERAIEAVRWKPHSRWTAYYTEQPGSYGQEAFDRKRETVTAWLQRLRPGTVWDLGANTGRFSQIAADHGANTIAFDADPACVELMYREARSASRKNLLPLVSDLANPSPGIGWGNAERMTLEQRGPADVVMALALVHHLAVGNNVPLDAIADYVSRIGRRLIIEFVPPSDGMVQQMLAGRAAGAANYTVDQFERAFASRFTLDEVVTLTPSARRLYLMSGT